jgi:tetratricopeptide (TPR) repeat protein
MTRNVNINTLLYYVIIPTLLCLLLTSCGLFDKELKQDQHIETFRYQLSRVEDSLHIFADRVKAFKTIVRLIEDDEDIITLRKKNMLLIDANNYISNEYVHIKNYTKALEYSNISISLDSTNAKGYFNRGCIYQRMEKDSLAMIDYVSAIKIDGNYADAYYNRGIIYEKSNKYQEALGDYNKAIKQQPSYRADIYNNRGNVYLALKDFSKALSDYSKVLDLDTTNINAYSNRAGLYIKQQELDKALEDCNKGLNIDSSFIRLYRQRASIYELKKNYEGAVDDYERVLALDHNDTYKVHDAIRRLRLLVKKKN